MFIDNVEVVPVDGFDDYFVSRDGRVWSTKGKGRWLKPAQNNNGYLYVVLCRDGKTFTKKLHRLVAEAFVPNDDPEHKTEVDHIDFDRVNNHADNLQWLSHIENVRKSICKAVMLVDTLSGDVEQFDSQKDAAAFLGCSTPYMSAMTKKPQMEYMGWCVLATKDEGGDWAYNKDRLSLGTLLGLLALDDNDEAEENE